MKLWPPSTASGTGCARKCQSGDHDPGRIEVRAKKSESNRKWRGRDGNDPSADRQGCRPAVLKFAGTSSASLRLGLASVRDSSSAVAVSAAVTSAPETT